MDAKPNLRGMIHLNQVEDLLSEILGRLNAQEDSLDRLTRKTDQLMTTESADRNISDIQAAIRSLSDRLDTVRDASMVRMQDKIVSSAELSALNNQKLKEIAEAVEKCARNSIVEERLKIFHEQYVRDIKQLEDSLTPIDMSRSLQAAVKESSKRVSRLEEALSTKLERSELRHIESLVSDLETYSEFKAGAREQIDQLEKSSIKLREQMESYARQLVEVFDSVQDITVEWKDSHTQIETNAKQLRKQVDDLKRYTLNSCVGVDTYSEILTWKESMTGAKCDLEEGRRLLEQRVRTLEEVVPSKADSKEVQRHYVRKENFGDAVRVLGADIDSRASQHDVNVAVDRITNIESSIEEHDYRLDISMRFVEWFTKRGETYEGNMQVIDKHLKNLATSSAVPGTRMPYTSKVRYQPIHEMMQKQSTTGISERYYRSYDERGGGTGSGGPSVLGSHSLHQDVDEHKMI